MGVSDFNELLGLRDDVYRRPLETALQRLGVGPGWRCADVGAGPIVNCHAIEQFKQCPNLRPEFYGDRQPTKLAIRQSDQQ